MHWFVFTNQNKQLNQKSFWLMLTITRSLISASKVIYKKCPLIQSAKSILFMNKFNFGSGKKNIEDQLIQFANSIKQKSINQDFSEVANNYIQLQQQSFIQFAKQTKNDPQMMLMFLSTFQNSQKVAQYLPMLYPYLDFYQKTQMLLLLEKVLAFKPRQKPKVPYPKPLQQIESVLVIMSEIYLADSLIQWIKLIPIYTGDNFYVLFMGYFSILQKMSIELKNRNRNLLIKCHEKIISVLRDLSLNTQIRIGILICAFELNYGQAYLLLLSTQIAYESIDPYKVCLLLINIQKYMLKKQNEKRAQNRQLSQEEENIQKQVIKQTVKMAQMIVKLQFTQFIKIEMMLQLFKILYSKRQLKSFHKNLLQKLLSLIGNHRFVKIINELQISQMLVILQTMERHKINNQKILKRILVLLSPHLYNMSKFQFVRLLKCLVTYVRQCQDYLINVRKVLEQRKSEFTAKEAEKVNQVLRRVEILFNKKFSIN